MSRRYGRGSAGEAGGEEFFGLLEGLARRGASSSALRHVGRHAAEAALGPAGGAEYEGESGRGGRRPTPADMRKLGQDLVRQIVGPILNSAGVFHHTLFGPLFRRTPPAMSPPGGPAMSPPGGRAMSPPGRRAVSPPGRRAMSPPGAPANAPLDARRYGPPRTTRINAGPPATYAEPPGTVRPGRPVYFVPGRGVPPKEARGFDVDLNTGQYTPIAAPGYIVWPLNDGTGRWAVGLDPFAGARATAQGGRRRRRR